MATPLTRAEWLDECAKLAKTYEDAMTDEAKARCSICKRPLDSPSDPTSLDCGGDCLRCMALIAEDPDCMTSYIKTQAREIERLRGLVSSYRLQIDQLHARAALAARGLTITETKE